MKRLALTLLIFSAILSVQNLFAQKFVQNPGNDYPLIFDQPVPLRYLVVPKAIQEGKSEQEFLFREIRLEDSEVELPELPDLRTPSEIEKSSKPVKIPLIYYTILSKSTGLAMAVSAAGKNDGENIILWTSNMGDEQNWELRSSGNGFFRLVAKHSGKYLAIREGKDEEGAEAIQWKDSGGDEQLWSIKMDADGYARIIAKHSGKCLSTVKSGGQRGESLVQRKRIDSDAQKWTISVTEIKWLRPK